MNSGAGSRQLLFRQLDTSILSFQRKSRYIYGIFDRDPGGYWMLVEDPVFIGDQVRHDGVSLFIRQVDNPLRMG